MQFLTSHLTSNFKRSSIEKARNRIPTREVKLSQTCYGCGILKKKLLSERWHQCDCGANCSRDERGNIELGPEAGLQSGIGRDGESRFCDDES
jgi:hypothetical protein